MEKVWSKSCQEQPFSEVLLFTNSQVFKLLSNAMILVQILIQNMLWASNIKSRHMPYVLSCKSISVDLVSVLMSLLGWLVSQLFFFFFLKWFSFFSSKDLVKGVLNKFHSSWILDSLLNSLTKLAKNKWVSPIKLLTLSH